MSGSPMSQEQVTTGPGENADRELHRASCSRVSRHIFQWAACRMFNHSPHFQQFRTTLFSLIFIDLGMEYWHWRHVNQNEASHKRSSSSGFALAHAIGSCTVLHPFFGTMAQRIRFGVPPGPSGPSRTNMERTSGWM